MHYADFYVWENVVYFDSIEDLVVKLNTTDFERVHLKMKKENENILKNSMIKWEILMKRMFKDVILGEKRNSYKDFELSMKKFYNIKIDKNLICEREYKIEQGERYQKLVAGIFEKQ
jgi:hypothetical protein